jgi:hypothetical protein
MSLENLKDLAKNVSDQLDQKGRVNKSDAQRLEVYLRLYLEKEEARRAKYAKRVVLRCVTCDQPLTGKKLKYCSKKCQAEERKRFELAAARGKAMCS